MKFGSWNVRTLCPGLDPSNTNHQDHLRTSAIVDLELNRYNIDIAALQETRLKESGSVRETNYTIYWQGRPKEETHQHGVGIAVKNTLMKHITTPIGTSERIISLKLSTDCGTVVIISAYAPTLTSNDDEKDKFYSDLQSLISSVRDTERLLLLGDFNARVGHDHSAWPDCLGLFGIGNINENGQRLLEFCSMNHLCITGSYFKTKNVHKVTWQHPRSKHWHQLDHIITKRKNLRDFINSRTYHGADCNTDHSLIIGKAKLKARKFHNHKHTGTARMNTLMMTCGDNKKEFMNNFEITTFYNCKPESACGTWEQLKNNIQKAGIEAFGAPKSSNKDWFIENSNALLPLIDARKSARLEFMKNPTDSTQARLKKAKSDLQRKSRICANEYWTNLCTQMQTAADTGNLRGLYDGLKTALGPRTNKVAAIKSLDGNELTDKTSQMSRWIQHYSDLYSVDRHIAEDALENVPQLETLNELDSLPTENELSAAIHSLRKGKAPGEDGIPPDLLISLKDCLFPHLYDLLLKCWKEGSFPNDMRNAKIVTLYKNKGDKGDCNNYRGISLLSVVGKVFARVILARLQLLAERVYPESQCGFRPSRSTVDMIFSLRQIQEKCREQNKPLYMCFVDLAKAFDTVSRAGLFSVLDRIGCPPQLLSLIASFHENMKATIQFDGEVSDNFQVQSGVKQGCVLAPTLFGIYFSVLLQCAFQNSMEGVYLRTRSDGKLFKIARLRAKTKTRSILIRELLFADDAALVCHSQEDLQAMLNRLHRACEKFSLDISVKKTVVMTQNVDHPTTVLLNDKPLVEISEFTYLGSTTTSNLSLDKELNTRIGKAATTFSRLKTRAWNNRKLTLKTKILIYQACVLSILLYGAETWSTYAYHLRQLNTFHMRCLRRILGITWQDKVPNTSVLERTGMTALTTIIKHRRLRWLGHVTRMSDCRLPKSILYGELETGNRGRGRPKLRFRDVCKQDMKDLNIDEDKWEGIAADRPVWRAALTAGKKTHHTKWMTKLDEARSRRKLPTVPTTTLMCTHCKRPCASKIGLISHTKACAKKTTVNIS